MAIQYAGGVNVNDTFTGGTKTQIADGVKDLLVAAGWSVVSGSSGSWVLNSATTAQGLQMRMKINDGGTNCARIQIGNVAETKFQTGYFHLLPGTSKTFRVIANRYQAFIFTPGSSAAREFACFGVPYLPGFLNTVITEACWGHGNTDSDTSTTIRSSFRTRLTTASPVNQQATQYYLVNGNQWECETSIGNQGGQARLKVSQGGHFSVTHGRNWHNGRQAMDDAAISWGLSAIIDEAEMRGILWSAAVNPNSYAADTTVTHDGKTFWAITGSNAGNSNDAYAAGTLFVHSDDEQP